MSVGNIHADEHWIVTPAGSWRLDRTSISTVDQTSTTTHTPAWAIVLTIVFIWFFLLSLLFLLAREVRVHGYISIVVHSDGQSYVDQIPVYNENQKRDIFNRVLFAQTLIGAARARGNA